MAKKNLKETIAKVNKEESIKEQKTRYKSEIDKLKKAHKLLNKNYSKTADALEALFKVCKGLVREVISLKAENKSLSRIVEKIKG